MIFNLYLWDENEGFLYNLFFLLKVMFLFSFNLKKEDFSVDCGICYLYRLGMEISEEVCNDFRCV